MKTPAVRACCVVLFCGLARGQAAEIDGALQRVDISRCVDVAAAAERLSCYDAVAELARGKRIQAPPPPAADTHSTDEEVAAFGKQPAQVVKRQDGREELHDTIAGLKIAPDGGWIITLRNGQVWRQSVAGGLNLKVGYAVRIYPSKWGSGYRLSAQELHGFIQVERLAVSR